MESSVKAKKWEACTAVEVHFAFLYVGRGFRVRGSTILIFGVYTSFEFAVPAIDYPSASHRRSWLLLL